ncbi:YbaK/EbsC family protein [Azospirillum halopraeferens]|uniref:YbaK/EbsC family protein n=1 Tax=Azospirillum halopraeferens TaxID=34010 RepID=UPI00040F1FDE|nr:YbaK/EbsC family protein [Azospirillum halopraeferens]
MADLSPSARRVQDILDGVGLGHTVIEHARSTRTSQEAADAVGCTVGQIAKSLIFRARTSGAPVLVIASGANRVDEKAVAALIGETIERADPEFVRTRTGFAIGGVPPLGHTEPPLVLIDEDLLALDTIWAAAGTPNAVFRLTPDQLVSMTGGRPAAVKKA